MSVRCERNEERDKKRRFATRKSIFIVSCLVHLFGFGHTHRCPITPRRPLIGITNLYLLCLHQTLAHTLRKQRKAQPANTDSTDECTNSSFVFIHLGLVCVCVVFFVCSAHTCSTCLALINTQILFYFVLIFVGTLAGLHSLKTKVSQRRARVTIADS